MNGCHWPEPKLKGNLEKEKMKIYVGSSWRNERQPIVIEKLRPEGHDDFDKSIELDPNNAQGYTTRGFPTIG